MSQTWVEDLESEDYESNGEADYEDPVTALDARAQRIMLERRRQQQQRQAVERRRPSAPPRRPMPPQRASRSLDLEMELHSLRRQVKESNRRASRGTWATVAGVLAAEAVNQFDPLKNHPIVNAAILGAPILLVSPEKQRSGFEGFLLDPRVIGAAAIVGIVIGGRLTRTSTSPAVNSIEINSPPSVPAGSEPTAIGAVAYDQNNKFIPGTSFSWDTSDRNLLAVTSQGEATIATVATSVTTPSKVSITAKAANGVSKSVTIQVTS
jgi:hypothetical protein